MGRGYGGGARCERSLRVTGAGAAEMMGRGYGGGARFERSLGVTAIFFGKQDLLDFLFPPGSCPTWLAVPPPASWSCRNGMGRGYGGGARFERSLEVTAIFPKASLMLGFSFSC